MTAPNSSEDEIRGGVRLRFQHALQALALPADIQLGLFPDFVVKADELALNFDHWWRCVQDGFGERLNNQQRTLLEAINDQFTQMSGRGNGALWTETAIHENPLWEQIRALAKEALQSFGWPNEIPPSYTHEYIGGNVKPPDKKP